MDQNAYRDENDTGQPDAYQPDAYQADTYQPDAYWRRRVITLSRAPMDRAVGFPGC